MMSESKSVSGATAASQADRTAKQSGSSVEKATPESRSKMPARVGSVVRALRLGVDSGVCCVEVAYLWSDTYRDMTDVAALSTSTELASRGMTSKRGSSYRLFGIDRFVQGGKRMA